MNYIHKALGESKQTKSILFFLPPVPDWTMTNTETISISLHSEEQKEQQQLSTNFMLHSNISIPGPEKSSFVSFESSNIMKNSFITFENDTHINSTISLPSNDNAIEHETGSDTENGHYHNGNGHRANIETGYSSPAESDSVSSKRNLPVKYRICRDNHSGAFTVTLMVPISQSGLANGNGDNNSPFQKVPSSEYRTYDNNRDAMDTYALKVPLSYLVNLSSQAVSNSAQQEAAPWLDRSTLRSRINDGGRAIGLEQSYIYQTMAAVEETASKLPQWCPSATETVTVEVILSEGIVTLVASASAPSGGSVLDLAAIGTISPSKGFSAPKSPQSSFNVLQEASGKLMATAPSFPAPGVRRSSSHSSSNHSNANMNHQNNSNNNNNNNSYPFSSMGNTFSEELKTNNSNNNIFNSPLLGSSLGSWTSYNNNNTSNNNNFNNNSIGQQHHHSSSLSSSLQGSNNRSQRNTFSMNSNSNIHFEDNICTVRRHNDNRNRNHNGRMSPLDPSIIVGPLLNLGFNHQECEAAANAIRNISFNRHSPTDNGSLHNQYNQNHHHHHHHQRAREEISLTLSPNRNSRSSSHLNCDELTNSMNNISFGRNLNQYHQGSSLEEVLANSSGTVWGNAGKLKSIKTPTSVDGTSETDDVTIDSDDKASVNMGHVGGCGSSSLQTLLHQQPSKIAKFLDIPPELNAFVFHCNAQTRDECLERGLFGCPSGGQYGPHSKAKKGDLLFLADFSAWTVTGIFTAKSDAGLNLEKSAWGGRFPWQIRVNEFAEFRTVHIDKINEIIGLASGSKLNMLTKDQLMSLVSSKEFGPCVPDHLYKMKSTTSV